MFGLQNKNVKEHLCLDGEYRGAFACVCVYTRMCVCAITRCSRMWEKREDLEHRTKLSMEHNSSASSDRKWCPGQTSQACWIGQARKGGQHAPQVGLPTVLGPNHSPSTPSAPVPCCMCRGQWHLMAWCGAASLDGKWNCDPLGRCTGQLLGCGHCWLQREGVKDVTNASTLTSLGAQCRPGSSECTQRKPESFQHWTPVTTDLRI